MLERFCDIHLRAISRRVPKLLLCIMSFRSILLKLLPRLVGSPESPNINEWLYNKWYHVDGMVQDCTNSSALAMELLQSCTEPSMWCHQSWVSCCRVIMSANWFDVVFLVKHDIILYFIGHLQVIDFGLAKWLKRGHRTRTICGTLQYIGEWKLGYFWVWAKAMRGGITM